MQVSRDGLAFFLTEHTGDCPVGGLIHLYVPDVDAWFSECRQKGVPGQEPPNECLQGLRSMTIMDPDGNKLPHLHAATGLATANRASRREADDNQCVRRLVAAAMLVLFASLNAIDGICCPDGCTHEQASTSQHTTGNHLTAACVLCLGGVESAVPHTPSASGTVTNRFAPLPLTHHLDAPTDPPDHPPRS